MVKTLRRIKRLVFSVSRLPPDNGGNRQPAWRSSTRCSTASRASFDGALIISSERAAVRNNGIGVLVGVGWRKGRVLCGFCAEGEEEKGFGKESVDEEDQGRMVRINRKNRVCKDCSRQLSQGNIPSPRSFFKIMIGNFREVLFIPPKFSETLVSLVNQNVYLEDSSGKSSKVKVARVDGSLAFQEGWHDFVADHCIDTGEILIFKYVSRALFLVQIFGRNACERVSFVEGNNSHLYRENITLAELFLEKSPLPKRYKSFEAPHDKYHISTKDSELEVEGDLSIPSNKMREVDCVADAVKNDYGSSKIVDAMDITGSLINMISREATEKPQERGNSIVEQPKAAVVNKTSLPKLKNVKTEPHSDHVPSLCIEENLAGHDLTSLPNLETVKTEPHSNHVTSLRVEENLAGHEHAHRKSPTASAVTYDSPLDFLCLSVTLSSNLASWIELPQGLPYCKGKTKKNNRLVILQDPSHRLWPVMYHESINFIGFSSGWKDFVLANNLQQGNQCNFFYVGDNDVFQVKITQLQNPSSEL